MKNVILLLNSKPGVEVLNFLKNDEKINITAVYCSDADNQYDEQIKATCASIGIQVFSNDKLNEYQHIQWLSEQSIDFLITVYWPWLLKSELFTVSKDTVNFHPALLPINRGWFPHVHSILDGSPCGVTLHAIDENADTGPIWVQKTVPLKNTDTAFDIYNTLQDEIVELFKFNWASIRDLKIETFEQNNENACYHKKSEIEGLDYIDIEKAYTARELINLLRARSFGNRGFAYLEDKGERVYLKLSLSDTSEF